MTAPPREDQPQDSSADSALSPANDPRRGDSIFDESSDAAQPSDPGVPAKAEQALADSAPLEELPWSELESAEPGDGIPPSMIAPGENPPAEPGSPLVAEPAAVDPGSHASLASEASSAPAALDGMFGDQVPAATEEDDPLAGIAGSEITATRASVRPPAAAPDRSFLWIVFLATYAATTTAALIYLAIRLRNSGGGHLESLPDVKPLKLGEFRQVRPSAVLPSGHKLALGDKTRFGNIIVEPLRITRGPLAFAHFDGDASKTRAPTTGVLKLWVRLTNASEDQTIAPLDDELLFGRKLSRDGDLLANNFVCREQDQPAGKPLVFLFDQPPASEWNLEGVAINRPLKPGESIETFLPTTEEGAGGLEGDLVWRFHLRKGHSPAGYGVTTLVEVAFPSTAIQPDAAAS
jgi:hypothetical protein